MDLTMKIAFTLLEIILVIIVIGIIIKVTFADTKADLLNQAATQLVSHIRYTQHLAMIDDKYKINDSIWYKKRWQIIFGTSVFTESEIAYSVFSDTSGSSSGRPDISETAINPLDRSKLLGGGYSGIIYSSDSRVTQSMNIGKTYGITNYNLDDGCSGTRIAFDNLGRPLRGNINSMTGAYHAGTQRLIVSTCNIILENSEGNITISIEPETGYTYIQ